MSRTKRAKKKHCYRPVKTKNAQTAELYAAQELSEEGFSTPPRQGARSNPKSGKLPDAWDDIHVAAWQEESWKYRKR